MVGVRVREEDGVHAAHVVPQRLRAQVRRRVHQHARTVVGTRRRSTGGSACRDGPSTGRRRSRSRSSARRATCRCRETAHARKLNASMAFDASRRGSVTRSISTPEPTAHHGTRRCGLRPPRGSWPRCDRRTAVRGIASRRTEPAALPARGNLRRHSTRSTAATSTGSVANWATCCSSASSTRRSLPERTGSTSPTSIEAIIAKLIRRHPHVFTPEGRPLPRSAEGPAPDRRRPCSSSGNRSRHASRPRRDEGGVLAGVPRALPALLRAHEIGARAAAVGFDWPETADVVDKIDEEVRELRAALREGPARTPKSWAICCSRWRTSRASSTSNPRPRCARERQVHAPLRRARGPARGRRAQRPRRFARRARSRVASRQAA